VEGGESLARMENDRCCDQECSHEAVVPVRPKPMVAGGRVFGEDGQEPPFELIISLIISYHGNGDASARR